MARRQLPIRNQVVAMLSTPGITHNDIAKVLHCSTRTIKRIAREVRPDIAEADSKLVLLQREVNRVITVQQRAQKYADLATDAKNEAVSLGALQRIDDLDGIVTEKERIRAKRDERPANQPMFQLPAGTAVHVTINQAAPPTSSDRERQHDYVNLPTKVSPDESGTGK
jgi:hypothetical protein